MVTHSMHWFHLFVSDADKSTNTWAVYHIIGESWIPICAFDRWSSCSWIFFMPTAWGAAVVKWLRRSKRSGVRFPVSPLWFQRLVISCFQVAILLKDRWRDVNPLNIFCLSVCSYEFHPANIQSAISSLDAGTGTKLGLVVTYNDWNIIYSDVKRLINQTKQNKTKLGL